MLTMMRAAPDLRFTVIKAITNLVGSNKPSKIYIRTYTRGPKCHKRQGLFLFSFFLPTFTFCRIPWAMYFQKLMFHCSNKSVLLMAFMLHLTAHPSFVRLYTSSQQCYEIHFTAEMRADQQRLVQGRDLLFVFQI